MSSIYGILHNAVVNRLTVRAIMGLMVRVKSHNKYLNSGIK